MDEKDLIPRLRALTPPGLDEARERAKVAARLRSAGVASARRSKQRPQERAGGAIAGWLHGRWRGIATVGLCLTMVAAAVSFTAPGRAAAGWFGERFGIGQPGGEPTESALRESWVRGTEAEGAKATVVARGANPYGGHYELLTYVESSGPDVGARCYELDFVPQRNSFQAGCEGGAEPLESRLPASDAMRIIARGSNSDPDDRFQFIAGRASSDISSIGATLNGEILPVELVEPSQVLLDEFGLPPGFKFFIAFPSLDASGVARFAGTGDGGPVYVSATVGTPITSRAAVH